MNYLHLIASMDPRSGGPCQGVRNLIQRVEEQGHSAQVVCLDDPDSDYLRHEKLPIHALGKGRGPWRYHPALRPWLEAHLADFEAVVLNGLWQYPAFLMSRLAQRPNMPPYFVFAHGMLDPWFQRAPERRLKAIRNWFYWKLIEHRVISNAEAVLFTCAEEMRLARDTFRPYHPKREIVVGYGSLPSPEYHDGMAAAFAEACPELKGRPYFLFLSRIHPKKGLDHLIKAYARVYGRRDHETTDNGTTGQGRDNETTDYRTTDYGLRVPPALVIAGPGLETYYGQQMQRLAAEVTGQSSSASSPWSSGQPSSASGPKTAPAVFFPGMLTGDAKWGALYQAEAFVLPSHQENFGIAVVEALACGTPVLISNQVNIWREITEDNAGLVANDTDAGTEQLFRQWQNVSPADRAGMKNAARSCFNNRFRIINTAKKLLATMGELTMRSRTPERLVENKISTLG